MTEYVGPGALALLILERVFTFVRSWNGNDAHSVQIQNLEKKVDEGGRDIRKVFEKINKMEVTLARDLPRRKKR